jgi:hypothetical protein
MGVGRLELGVREMGKNLKPAVTDANIECREA